MLQRLGRFIKARILHINDSPQRIAMGVAIGLFIAWTPILGVHMFLVIAVCALLRANKLVGFVSVWINNPFTFIPIYYPSYVLGRAVVGFLGLGHGLAPSEVMQTLKKMSSIGNTLTSFCSAEFWHQLFEIFLKIGLELWVGCLIIGFIMAIAGYFITYRFVVLHRRKKPRRRYAQFQ